MIIELLKLVVIRGAGVIIYTLSAIYFLPESNVVASILASTIIDFLVGMLYPTFKTAVVSARVDIHLIFGLTIIISIALVTGVYFFHKNTFSTTLLLYLIIVAIFPFFVKAGTLFELQDVEGHIALEALISFVSAIIASIFLVVFKLFDIDSYCSTPLLRVFFYCIFCIFFYQRNGYLTAKIKPRFSFDIQALRSFIGIEYLILFSVFRAKILYLISSDINSQGGVKLITLLYDPVSAFYGYYLRTAFARVGFESAVYFVKIWPLFFMTLSGALFFVCLFDFPQIYGIALIVSVVALLISLAGLTTSYIVGFKISKILYILVYAIVMALFEYLENIEGGLIVSLISLMLIVSLQRNGRI
jgi:hypothetical protein